MLFYDAKFAVIHYRSHKELMQRRFQKNSYMFLESEPTALKVHVVADDRISFFLVTNIPSCIYTSSSLSVQPRTDKLVCSHILAIADNGAMNMGMRMSFQCTDFI